MAGINNLSCFLCLNIFPARTLSRIDGVNNNIRREVAIQRRDGLNHPPLEVTDRTRLCINCSRSINEEIAATERDQTCLRLCSNSDQKQFLSHLQCRS